MINLVYKIFNDTKTVTLPYQLVMNYERYVNLLDSETIEAAVLLTGGNNKNANKTLSRYARTGLMEELSIQYALYA